MDLLTQNLIQFLWFSAIVIILALPFIIFLQFTFVKEGTAKIVMLFGSFHKVLLAKKGYIINADGDIVLGSASKKLPGGLRFVGIRWIHTIYKRELNWVKSLPDGTFESRSDPNVDFILAKVDYPYGLKIEKAESKDLLRLDAKITLTASIINPYKAQFAVNEWFTALISRIAPSVREYISNYTYEEIINDPNVQLDRDIFEKLSAPGTDGSDSIIDTLKTVYGIEVHALETVNIDPDESYRKATLAKWQAARDAEKRLGSTTGALMAMIANQTGAELDEIRTEFKANPDVTLKKYEGLIRMNKDFIEQQIASDAGSLRRYYFQGGTGGMDLIALLGDVFRGFGGGKSGSGSTENPSKGGGKKRVSDMTEDEKKAEYERIKKGG